MDRILQSIFTRPLSDEGPHIILNPVSWDPDTITNFNERLNALMPGIERDRHILATGFGATLSGTVNISGEYLDEYGFLVASLFCVGKSCHMEPSAFRKCVAYLARGFGDYKFRVPERFGIPDIRDATRNDGNAILKDKLEHVGISVSVWH